MCIFWLLKNWTDGLEWCGLLWCFYQLFGLSFWRHPFTAEDPLVRQWYNDTFLQIWWRNKLNYILDDLRVIFFMQLTVASRQMYSWNFYSVYKIIPGVWGGLSLPNFAYMWFQYHSLKQKEQQKRHLFLIWLLCFVSLVELGIRKYQWFGEMGNPSVPTHFCPAKSSLAALLCNLKCASSGNI